MALSEIKRKQIIKAATSEFLKQGFQGCGMDRIAESANVSKRTVYNHFSSKEELFLSILEHLGTDEHPVYDHDFSTEQPIEQQLVEIATIEVEILQSNEVQKFARILLGELVRSDEMAELFKSKRPSCYSDFILWLESAISKGALSVVDKEFAAEQFFGLLESHAFWPLIFRNERLDDKRREHVVSSTVSMFLTTYKSK